MDRALLAGDAEAQMLLLLFDGTLHFATGD
jgi:hypothetical protein